MIEPRRTYGRRVKRLRQERTAAVTAMGDYFFDLKNISAASLNPRQWMENAKATHLEIGFGTGEHLAHHAEQNQNDIFLAAEPYTAGAANLMKLMQDKNISNIRVYQNDGFALLQALQSNSIDHAYLLFPDPWPKNRHSERRFIQNFTLDEFVRVICTGGTLLLATDDIKMLDWMLMHILPHPQFQWVNETAREWRAPPTGHIHSRYAEKAMAQEKPLYYLSFTRI
ncbi:MAG TPA: tRNA (guanosine(46)-N7)-methyltransferase TrmB [Alphaproteobacteria bacterium]|nr:tRNA (guanosine(46)-N7)-methyltransferase TrmB [Alphaproteobacteria bacterium]